MSKARKRVYGVVLFFDMSKIIKIPKFKKLS